MGLLLICGGGALLNPILGVAGYMSHYVIGPERQWWAAPINHLGIRYSYTLALLTAVGMALHWGKINFGKSFLVRQEKLILAFLGVVWLARILGSDTVGWYSVVDHPSVKFTKIVIFAIMMSHVVTNLKNLDRLLWIFIFGAVILGIDAFGEPRSSFVRGRLNTVGGSDFTEANALAAYLAAMLPIIAVQFLRSGWIGKAICLVAGVFATNAIILTRSRGAVIGIVAGLFTALMFAPAKYRGKILVGLVVLILGGLYLADPQFMARISTITYSEDQMDSSSQSRIEVWQGGIKMFMAHPLGVGPGNFYQEIGNYAVNHPHRDAHSAFIRCAGELGVLGIVLFSALIINALIFLRRIIKQASALPRSVQDQFVLAAFGLIVSLAVLTGSCVTMTLLYMEGLWWMLIMPACLQRIMENIEIDITSSAQPAPPKARRGAFKPPAKIPSGRRRLSK